MSATADIALAALNRIFTEHGDFVQKRGQTNEADTRAKVIDRILKEALNWPEESIRREVALNAGYLDYELTHTGRPTLVVEAKRSGTYLEVPANMQGGRTYKLNGALMTSGPIK